jgi:hypothetical protein
VVIGDVVRLRRLLVDNAEKTAAVR